MEEDIIEQKLNAILGVEADEQKSPANETFNNDLEIIKDNDLSPIIEENNISNNDNEFEQDFEFARKNMKEISNMGMKAIKDLSSIARESQTPRIYEVLSNMMKNISDINANIIDNHSKKISQQPVEEANSVKVNSIENAVFCTSYDVLKKIKQHK